jgi:carboxypeptidase C (cathepsin A)
MSFKLSLLHCVPRYSWSKVANLLFLESPAGVGFSYCEAGALCNNTDESTADDTADFFTTFFEQYSEFKANDFFITGESYAGVQLLLAFAAR